MFFYVSNIRLLRDGDYADQCKKMSSQTFGTSSLHCHTALAAWIAFIEHCRELGTMFNFFIMMKNDFLHFYKVNLTWIRYFNRSGPKVNYFYSTNGLEVTFSTAL